MYSSQDNRCTHRLGFPIRTSPDHRLLASPRGLSQLATSFIAYLRQGIHTHALSSLTIKFTLDTEYLKRSQESGDRSQNATPADPALVPFALPATAYWLRSSLMQLL